VWWSGGIEESSVYRSFSHELNIWPRIYEGRLLYDEPVF